VTKRGSTHQVGAGVKRHLRRAYGLSVFAVAAMVLILAPTSLAGASPAPTVTITPATAVADHSKVTVRGSGFPPSDAIIIAECEGTLQSPPLDATSCDGGTADTTANADLQGNFLNSPTAANGTAGYTMRALAKNGVLGIDCDSSNPCVLYVGVQLDDFTQPHTLAAITWAPGTVGTASGQSSSANPTTALSAPAVLAPAGASQAAAALPASDTTGSLSSAAGTLPRTGLPGRSVLLGTAGIVAIALASFVRRVALKRPRHG
jgi:hypothetical protein